MSINVFDRHEFSPAELAIMLGRHRNTILRQVKKGYIPARVMSEWSGTARKHYRIPVAWIKEEFSHDWKLMLHKLELYKTVDK